MTSQVYNLDGPKEFPFPYPVRAAAQLTVEIVPGNVVSPGDYEVVGVGPTSTQVTVRYPNAPTAGGLQLKISRYVAPERVTVIDDPSDITTVNLNAEFNNIYEALLDFEDYILALVQDLVDEATQARDEAVAAAVTAVEAEEGATGAWDAFQDRYWGAYASDPAVSPIGNPPTGGDLYWNTTAAQWRVWDAGVSLWVSATSSVPVAYDRRDYIATAGQTTFGANYDAGYVQVWVNGLFLPPSDYEASSGTEIVLHEGVQEGAEVTVIGLGTYSAGVSTSWGDIGGKIADQADLYSALTNIGEDIDSLEGLVTSGLQGGAPIYPDTATGLANTSEGQFFTVPGAGDDYSILYRHDPGDVATELARSPSVNMVIPIRETMSFYRGEPINRAGVLVAGYIDRNDGTEQVNNNWSRTDFIELPERAVVSRIGTTIPSAGNAAGIAFYDASFAYLGDSPDGTGTPLVVADLFPDAAYVRASFVTLDPERILTVDTQIVSAAVEGMTALSPLADSVQQTIVDWLASPAGNGYIDLSGAIVASANWVYSDWTPVIPGATYVFTGRGNTAAVANVASYDEDRNFLAVEFATSTAVEDVSVTISAAGAAYLRASAVGTEPHAFVVDARQIPGSSVAGFQELKDAVGSIPDLDPLVMAPDYVYGLDGEALYLYSRGVVSDRSIDLAWNKQEGNNEFLKLVPAPAEPPLLLTGIQGSSRAELANIPVRVASAPISPSAPLNFICLGDSLTDGNAHSGIDGAFPNELSRRLTGFGTDILGNGPAPLNLSNIVFRGTRGDQPVKHEGRGGWRAMHYLNYASVGSFTNAFWNPATEEFDIDYYLEQNGFRDIDVADGVTSTGDNLVMIILLGWNDVYNSNAVTAAGYMRQLIDIILSKKPATRFIIPSLQPAPYANLKTFSGVRYVSESEVFRSIREFALEYQSAISDVAGAEFLHLNHTFNANAGYNTADVSVAARGGETITVTPDHVHPNAVGYAMIADALYYNILWRFCQ